MLIHFGSMYYGERDFYIDPGIGYKSGKNIILLSNDIYYINARFQESTLGLYYRRYPFSNQKKSKVYFWGGLIYYHTEGYSYGFEHVDGIFGMLGAGFNYNILRQFIIGLETGIGPGTVPNSEHRWYDSGLLFHAKFAITLSYFFEI